MLKKMTYLAVTAAMLAVSSVSFAQPNRGGDLRGDRRELRQDRHELRSDRREFRRDRREFRRDRREFRHAHWRYRVAHRHHHYPRYLGWR